MDKSCGGDSTAFLLVTGVGGVVRNCGRRFGRWRMRARLSRFLSLYIHVLSVLSNRDLIQFDEKSLKMILLTLWRPSRVIRVEQKLSEGQLKSLHGQVM